MITLAGVVNVINWMQVLAVPRVYGTLGKAPTRELMLTQVDFYLEYIRGGKCFTDATFPDPPYNEREAHALRLRALFEQWIPPDLTDEMILTVRRLLYAEGCEPPGGWDNIHPPSEPMADSLIWS